MSLWIHDAAGIGHPKGEKMEREKERRRQEGKFCDGELRDERNIQLQLEKEKEKERKGNEI